MNKYIKCNDLYIIFQLFYFGVMMHNIPIIKCMMIKMHHKHNNNDEIKIKMKHSEMFKWQ